MTTGQRIKLKRELVYLSVRRLADMLDVSPATIYRYENGDIEKIPSDRLVAIAEALMTTPGYLMGLEEDPDLESAFGNKNIIKIAGRDGSYAQRTLSDQQLAALKAILDQMPDVPDGL